jgi:hypothetical protein
MAVGGWVAGRWWKVAGVGRRGGGGGWFSGRTGCGGQIAFCGPGVARRGRRVGWRVGGKLVCQMLTGGCERQALRW